MYLPRGLQGRLLARAWLTAPHRCWPQDLATLDASKLTPLSPEVISRQATINIGGASLQAPCTRRAGGHTPQLQQCRRAREPAPHKRQRRRQLLGGLLETVQLDGAVGIAQQRFRSRQPALHGFAAGTIGHVAHGKSTVVKAISGVQTVRFKNELERNITIKLGYANAKIYKCECGGEDG